MSKILVTGARGFIGSALCQRLKVMDHEIIALDSADGDIAEWQTLACFGQEDIRHVFHLAGKTYVPASWDDPQGFFRANVLGTFNVLELCKKKHIPLTYVSAYVYGIPDILPIREDSTIRPNNPYALSKRMAEESCEFYANAHNLGVTIVRPFNVYGIGQDERFLIPTIIRQALGSREICVKDLAPRRDYVYLEDAVTALLATMRQGRRYRVYNLGAGMSMSVREIIDIIQDVAGVQKKIVCENVVRTSEIMDVVADISRIGEELEWRPQTGFRVGIENIIRSGRSGVSGRN